MYNKNLRKNIAGIILVFLVIGLLFGHSLTKGSAFGVEVGDTFTFVVNKYSIAIDSENLSTSVDQFSVAGSENISAGTEDAKFSIEVLEVDTSSILGTSIIYEIRQGTNKENTSGDAFSVLTVAFLVLLPLLYVGVVTGESSLIPLTADNNVKSATIFVLPVENETDPIWDTLADTALANTTSEVTTDDSSFSQEQTNSKVNGNFEAVSKFSGILNNATTSDSISFDSQTRVVYELATGVLQGFKSVAIMEGSNAGKAINFNLNIEIVREGFTILGFGEATTFGFELLIVLVTFLPLAILTRKIRHNNKN